jgi:transcriptional regulator with XRE-family HTH domain
MRVLGRRLELLRRRQGWTYRDLERRTGVPHSTLQYLITRRRTAPDYYALVALVQRLGGSWDPEWERLWQRAAGDLVANGPVDVPAPPPHPPAHPPTRPPTHLPAGGGSRRPAPVLLGRSGVRTRDLP